MLIYKDIINDSELLSDAVKIEVVDDFFLKVKSKMVTEAGGIDDSLIGGNKSQEEQHEQTEETVQKVIDLVHYHKLQQHAGLDKKGYTTYIKTYMKLIKAKILEDKGEEASQKFATAAATAVPKIIKQIKDYDFYIGEQHYDIEDEGMVVLATYEGEDQSAPVFWYFKDGLVEEKC